ncbi:hypothetical protein MKZ38_009972 [Zalerion maritima]|uniref:Centromere protein X n=1 Tax=Zalerion maritima TaxID=339359 RepID=A0AAD5RST3_9PEZI|nr:hypothetical protein MKZ38_009972 [Zalerion maritima]
MAPPKQAKSSSSARQSAGQDMDFDAFDDVGVAGEPSLASVDEDTSKAIPGDLLVRLLHQFFEKDGTKISRDANAAVAKYVDVFVKEAIARTAHERSGSFLEVLDLEKVAPQLLLDL